MSFRKILDSVKVLAILAVTMFATALSAQEPPSKVDVFTGYSFQRPGVGDIGAVVGAQENLRRGVNVATTYFVNRNWGITFDGDWHACRCDPKIWSFTGGPTYRWPGERVTPFVHAFAGLNRMKMGAFGWDNGLGVIAGGGLDVKAWERVSLRVIQADYTYSRHNFTPAFGTTNMHGYRLAAGLVFRFGSIGPPPVPASATCSVQQSEVMAGEPVTATASGSNFNPKRTMRYKWSGTGVKVFGESESTQIDTTGLAPGSYQVNAELSDGSRNGVASCSTSFSVRAPAGPSITCSADPSTIAPGGSSTIRSSASSPDRRPLTYSYSSSAGNISGSGSSVMLGTSGAQPGTINVTCNVADDRNPALTASSSTSVMVEAPEVAPPAPAPAEASQINEIDFAPNSPRVDNAAKAVLDEVALRLQRDSDARAVLIGTADASERGAKQLAARRALNTKAYLVNEKGIDASRLETRTGTDSGRQTHIWLVPAGATFNPQGTEMTGQPKP